MTTRKLPTTLMSRRGPRRRAGAASLEAVMLTAVFVPLSAALLWMGCRVCVALYHLTTALVNWPFL